MKTILIYIAVINVIAFVLFGVDKWKAKHVRGELQKLRY